MKHLWLFAILVALAGAPALQAEEDNTQLGLRLSYVHGVLDVDDWYEAYTAAYGTDDAYILPVDIALELRQYVGQTPRDWFLWGDLGPALLSLSNPDFTAVPAGLGLGLEFDRYRQTSPYLKLGARHWFVNGDGVDGSETGIYGGFGLRFAKRPGGSFFLEAGWDSSAILFKDSALPDKQADIGFMLSFGYLF